MDFSDRRFFSRILRTAPNNFVERPWGGMALRAFKGLCPLPEQVQLTGAGLGESFEISAFADDIEAAAHPTIVTAGDGASYTLPDLVRDHGPQLLGERWLARHGNAIPLLPKFLNVRELLSVQGHPAGHTEAYIVVDAEPGATIRLGFSRDIDAPAFREQLRAGLDAQRALADLLGADAKWQQIQASLSQWFAVRDAGVGEMRRMLTKSATGTPEPGRVDSLLERLRDCYWMVLDAMNEVPLQPGQVIYNSNPERIVGNGTPAAEVHALGNPQQREFVMLEVRRPGPTFRAWDNVRFPMRDVDIDAALDVLNLRATHADEFMVEPQPGGQPGFSRSVTSPFFVIEHIDVAANGTFEMLSEQPHCLHVLSGELQLQTDAGEIAVSRGQSAFVPYGVDAYSGIAGAEGAQLVQVFLP